MSADVEALISPDRPNLTPRGRRTALQGIKRLAQRDLFVVASALVALTVAFTVINGVIFIEVTNLQNMALAMAVNLILAVGITYVLITAGFDLSVGSVLVFSGVVSVKAMTLLGGAGWAPSLVGLLVALGVGAAWGLANGFWVAYAGLNPIIVTLASLGAALGLAQVITGGQDLSNVPNVMLNFGTGHILGVPTMVIIALAVALVAGIGLRKTVFGRYTYAVGSNIEAARRSGISVRRHLAVIYGLSGFLAGFAGWLSLAIYGTTNIGGHSLDALNAATAALLGGVSLYGGAGTILGATLGTLIPVVLASGLVIAGLQSFWQQVVTGAVLLGAVYLDRERRQRRERAS